MEKENKWPDSPDTLISMKKKTKKKQTVKLNPTALRTAKTQ